MVHVEGMSGGRTLGSRGGGLGGGGVGDVSDLDHPARTKAAAVFAFSGDQEKK